MQNEQRLTDEDQAMAEALAQLRPKPTHLDAWLIASQAIDRSSRRGLIIWRGIAAALALGLVMSLLLRPQPRTVKQLVYIDRPQPVVHAPEAAPPPPREPIPDLEPGDDYLSVRSRVLALGVEVLRPPVPVAARFPPMRALDMPSDSRPVHSESLLDSFNPFRRGERS